MAVRWNGTRRDLEGPNRMLKEVEWESERYPLGCFGGNAGKVI